jgi:uncharacterized membrane protein
MFAFISSYKSRYFLAFYIVSVFVLTLLLGHIVYAQIAPEEEVFEARVIQILAERDLVQEGAGQTVRQQDLKLLGLSGLWEGKEITFQGIVDVTVVSGGVYKLHDKVIVSHSVDAQNKDVFTIIDYVRRGSIYALAALFVIVVLFVGRRKGLKSLVSLVFSFLVIMQLIVPRILAGDNPLIIGIIGSFVITLFIVYITEGFNKKAHLATLSIGLTLVITAVLSIVFAEMARLTGLAQEEATYLVGVGSGVVDFRGLLLAAFLIGILGVLDDLIISQIETVAQLKKANPEITRRKLFKLAFTVGNSHLAAVINTLFLAYTGAALPLLLLFSLNQGTMITFGQVINNELVATEIIRTLIGSIGLALSVPIATFLAVRYIGGESVKRHI